MAKARAIVKRRKAVRNIKKITKTMQMIATAKFQKSLKRATGTKAYTLKVRELVSELAASIGDVDHPLLRNPAAATAAKKIALIVLTSNRGLAGAYNGSVLRAATSFIRTQTAAGKTIELYLVGKKGVSFFTFAKRPIFQKMAALDTPLYADVEPVTTALMKRFVDGEVDSVHVAYMNFISAGVQRAEVMTLLPLASLGGAAASAAKTKTVYEFSPSAKELLDALLPLTVKTALFQAYLDATTSEHVSRMVAMKSATDNADKMVKSLSTQYNRARQTQITTELAEIMGGVEAMAK